MKKYSLVFVGLAVIGFTSCKKSYTCSCTTLNQEIDLAYEKNHEDDVKEKCEKAQINYQQFDSEAACNLK